MVSWLTAALVGSAKTLGTVIMIHGAGGGGWEYDFWANDYRKSGWTVVARDLEPAQGGLAKTELSDYESQVERWTDHAQRPLILVGASMGGALALKAAQKLKPDAVILINSAPPAGFQSGKTQKVPAVIKWANGPLQDTRDAMPDSDGKTVLWAWKLWRDESGAVVSSLHRGVKIKLPTCPVLVIIGTADTDVSPEVSLKVADFLHADVFRYSGTSHVGPLMGKRAHEIAAASLRWLHEHVVLSSHKR